MGFAAREVEATRSHPGVDGREGCRPASAAGLSCEPRRRSQAQGAVSAWAHLHSHLSGSADTGCFLSGVSMDQSRPKNICMRIHRMIN